MVRELFDKNDIQYELIDVDDDPDAKDYLLNKTGQLTVPQIFDDDEFLGAGLMAAMKVVNGYQGRDNTSIPAKAK